MNKNLNIIITAFVIWLSLYTNAQIELFVSSIFVLSLGLIHGSNDIHLLKELLLKTTVKKWKLVSLYVGLGALVFVLAFYFRILGLIVFMIVSSYHFGEQHLHHRLALSRIKASDFTLYGLVIFAMLFSTHKHDVQYLILEMTDWDITGLPLNKFTIVLAVLLLISWVIQFKRFKKDIFEEIFYLIMFYVVFYNTELPLSFGVYFVIWHAIPSIKDQILLEGQVLNLNSALRYLKQSYLYWLVSVIGIFILFQVYEYLGNRLFPMLFAALVAITFPHIVLIMLLFSKVNPTSKP